MSTYDGNSIPTTVASDDTDDRHSQRTRRRIENRRNRHDTRRQLHVTASYPIRRLLASV